MKQTILLWLMLAIYSAWNTAYAEPDDSSEEEEEYYTSDNADNSFSSEEWNDYYFPDDEPSDDGYTDDGESDDDATDDKSDDSVADVTTDDGENGSNVSTSGKTPATEMDGKTTDNKESTTATETAASKDVNSDKANSTNATQPTNNTATTPNSNTTTSDKGDTKPAVTQPTNNTTTTPNSNTTTSSTEASNSATTGQPVTETSKESVSSTEASNSATTGQPVTETSKDSVDTVANSETATTETKVEDDDVENTESSVADKDSDDAASDAKDDEIVADEDNAIEDDEIITDDESIADVDNEIIADDESIVNVDNEIITDDEENTGDTEEAIDATAVTDLTMPIEHKVETGPSQVITIDIRKYYDPVLDPKKILTLQRAANGIVINNQDGTLTYLPNKDFVGVDTILYTVTDAAGNVTDATVKVSVKREAIAEPVPAACQIYMVHDQDVDDTQILALDPSTVEHQMATKIGPVYNGLDIEGLGIEPASRLLYAISGSGSVLTRRFSPNRFDGYLYQVNPQTGALIAVGDTGYSEVSALAFHPDGTLWAWSNGGLKNGSKRGGLIRLDLKTAKGELLMPSPLSAEKKIEGLAWNVDGTQLYASEDTTLWVFDGKDFQKQCQQLPGDLEALETLADNMLLFVVHQQMKSTVYVYDPNRCEIVLDRPVRTVDNYEDVEGIAWPITCQSATVDLSQWEITFDSDLTTESEEATVNSEEVVCETKAQWLEVTGKVKLDPPASQAFFETYWQLIDSEAEKDACPPKDKAANLASSQSEDCRLISYPTRLISGDNVEFRIKGWWPGFADKKTSSVETLYGVRLYDNKRNLLATQSVTRVGGTSLCAGEASEEETLTCTDKKGKPIKGKNCPATEETEDTTCLDAHGKPQKDEKCDAALAEKDKLETPTDCVDAQGKPAKNCADTKATDSECGEKGKDCLTEVEEVTDDSKEAVPQAALNAPALKRFFNELGADLVRIDQDGQITVTVGDYLYQGFLSYSLPDDTAEGGKVTLTPAGDANDDGYPDFAVTYSNGQVQMLFYLGFSEKGAKDEQPTEGDKEGKADESVKDDKADKEESAKDNSSAKDDKADKEESAKDNSSAKDDKADKEESAKDNSEKESAKADKESSKDNKESAREDNKANDSKESAKADEKSSASENSNATNEDKPSETSAVVESPVVVESATPSPTEDTSDE
jgi:hypothetical protein